MKKMNKFKKFKLIFDIICFDCRHKVTINFLAGDLFKIEGDLILSDAEYIILEIEIVKIVRLVFSLILKRFSRQEE